MVSLPGKKCETVSTLRMGGLFFFRSDHLNPEEMRFKHTQKSPSSASLGFSRLVPVAYVPGRPSEIPNIPERSNQGWIKDIWLPILATTVEKKTYGRCSWREHLGLHPRTETPSSVI